MSESQRLEALEILDSHGNPTIAVTVTLNNGAKATAKIPSGGSTGTREAVELRDGVKGRYAGKGVLEACSHVENEIKNAVQGMDPTEQRSLDERLSDNTQRL
jgi:enolase